MSEEKIFMCVDEVAETLRISRVYLRSRLICAKWRK